ncbi:MAG TPA: glycosyltransferase family 2 protein [Chitinophagales bacterium]|nr:glycosyltransferase family 2 protein [Chitinophagales bacterium]
MFWTCLSLVIYTYIGYAMLLFLLVRVKKFFSRQKKWNENQLYLPEVTVLVAAYNEADFIEEKIKNCLAFDYPEDKIHFLFITDGSDDGTPERVKKYPQIQLLHQPERKGKIAATNRAMPFVKTPVVVFTDANTAVNKEAIRNMVKHYADKKTGVVSGEKRILMKEKDTASGAGEGIYWKYESKLKKWDSELYSVVGAAGELFSIRTELFQPVPQDTIVEDFYMTLSIAKRGYRIAYEPEAYAMEGPSASVSEELKRKIRIAAGGMQAIVRLSSLLNPFKYGLLSFQYISHRVLRWTLAPLSLPLLFISNIILAWQNSWFFKFFLAAQILFYVLALIGFLLEQQKIKLKAFFVPYYFFIMNYAVYAGFFRAVKGSQSVIWEKAKRG